MSITLCCLTIIDTASTPRHALRERLPRTSGLTNAARSGLRGIGQLRCGVANFGARMRPMTSFPANGRKRGRPRHWLLLGWAACAGFCGNAAWSQAETAAVVAVGDAVSKSVDLASYQQRIDSATEQYGKNSLPTAEAYSDLADAQRHAGQHEQATQNYVTAIEIYRAVDGPFTGLAIPLLLN